MPGRDSYGPAGKWIHDRAHRIMSDSPDTPKSVAYAIATQQGHKVGKSPKAFRTSRGVREAKAKFQLPKKEYQKTAGAEEMMARRLKTLISLRDKGYTSDRENREIKFLTNQLYGDGSMKTAQLAGLFDELEKMAGIGSTASKILEAVLKTPARKFLLGMILGSALYSGLDNKKKRQISEATDNKQPIVIMPPGRMDALERDLSKSDPEDTLGLGRLSQYHAPDIRDLMEKKSEIGELKPPELPKLDTDLAAKRLKASQNIGMMGRRQPPKPTIRGVVTKI